ncbi:PKD domain-containing protein [Maribacter flavus]|uniref:PKD domain-containing protein n=1 Tax=Maribacter flavus TaxID=1658664 RepID=UPI00137568C0|nr:PKD domain-containing protein [Maribacter flavus]
MSATLFGAGIMSFGPMFFGPGMTTPEAFSVAVNTGFPVAGVNTPAYEVAFPNLTFDSPITFNPVPGQNRIVVGQLDGKVYWISTDNSTAQRNLIVDWSSEVGDRNEGAVWDGGFLGLAIHPDFGTDPTKNYMFAYYSTNAASNNLGTPQGFRCSVENFSGNYLVLARFRVDPVTMSYVPNSQQIMMRRELYNTTHRGGGMTFGPDGYLYVTTGDQATYANAQDIANNLDGGVLRLDVDMNPATGHAPKRFLQDPGVGNTHPDSDGLETSGAFYFIPNDNPFNVPLGDSSSPVFEEYYTIGHRSPHRLTMDSATGDLYIGEVGEATHEEINILRNSPSTAGNNYGWPFYEGFAGFTPPTQSGVPCNVTLYPGTDLTDPLTDFTRQEAWSIIGGYVYNGSIAQYQGRYIAGDYVTNQLYAIDTQSGAKENLGVGPGEMISFGQDSNGELYILRLGNNGSGIYRLRESIDINSAPTLLSDTGVFVTDVDGDFSDIGQLSVTNGFIPYDMIQPFWSDGALKSRWMAIPNNGTHDTPAEQIQWSEDGDWQFPVGSVLVKHFDYPDESRPNQTRKIETRFSIKGTDGNFYFLTYKWNAAETDATLVDMSTGETVSIDITRGGNQETIEWLYPSNSQCLNCHNPALGGTLGPRTRNLNSDYDYSAKGGTVGNQLVTLSTLGILNENITDTDTPGYLTHKAIDDLNATLDERARSYLDNNCAYCHQPATGNRADFDLRLFNTLAQTGLLTAGINQAVPAMAPDQEILFPGDASKSQLYHRANSLEPGVKMPPLAKGIVDTEGVALLEAWINQLEAPAPPPLGDYRIVNRASGQTLQVPDAGTANSANVATGGYAGLAHQNFALEDAAVAGYHQLKALHSDKYLDVAAASTANGANVWQYTGNGTDAQLWELVDAGDDTYNIISKLSGYYLGTEPNGNVVVAANNGSDIFRWEFQPTGSSLDLGITVEEAPLVTSEDGMEDEISIVLDAPPATNVVLTINGITNEDEFSLSVSQVTFTPANWDTPQLVTITGVDDTEVDGVQYFTVEISVDDAQSDPSYSGFTATIEGYNSDDDGGGVGPPALGIYRIVNFDSGETLQVPNASTANLANITENAYEGLNHQHLELEYAGNNLYKLKFVHSGSYLDVAQGSAAPGTNVLQYEDNGGNTDAQFWQIVDAGDGTFHLISQAGGHYLGTQPNGNVYVQLNDGSDIFRWQFSTPSGPLGNGITVSPEVVAVSEDGQTDILSVVLTAAPTEDVVLTLVGISNIDEFNLSLSELTFTSENWDTPQEVTVSGVDDTDVDGVQYFEIEIAVDAVRSDALYTGFSLVVDGYNSDDDGGGVGAPVTGTYRLINRASGETLQVPDASLLDQANVAEGTYNNTDNQHFELEYAGNNLYSLRVLHSDKYLDVATASTAVDTNIWQYEGNGSDAQLWQIVDAGDGTFYLISELSGYYLGTEPDGNVIVKANDGSDTIRWEFTFTGYAPTAIAESDIIDGEAPLDVSFTGDASTDDIAVTGYLWDFGDGSTSTEANPIHTFDAAGSYDVVLTVTDGGGLTDTAAAITITVFAPNGAPTAVASSDVSEGEVPLEVSFTGDGSIDDIGINEYLWDFGDGVTATEANPVHTFMAVNTYEVSLTVTDAGGLTDTTTLSITVNPVNEAPTAMATSNINEGEAPLEVTFTGDGSTDDVAITEYLWDFEDGTTSTDANPIHTFNAVGTYDVLLTVTDAGGLTDTDMLTITVTAANGIPTAIATSDVSEGLAPLDVSFTGDGSIDDSGITEYLWDFGDGVISAEANPVHTFVAAGNYNVVLTVTDAGGLTDEDSLTITVTGANDNPTAVATSDISEGEAPLEVSFTGDGSTDDLGVTEYLWDFGDGVTSTEANPVHIFDTAGTFDVLLTVTDAGGLTDTATLTIEVIDNETNSQDVEIIIAPNPASQYAYIYFNDLSIDRNTIIGFTVHDTGGRLIAQYMESEVYSEQGMYTIPMFGLRDEFYAITISFTEGPSISKRVIVRN